MHMLEELLCNLDQVFNFPHRGVHVDKSLRCISTCLKLTNLLVNVSYSILDTIINVAESCLYLSLVSLNAI